MPPILSPGRASYWFVLVYAIVLFVIPFALLIPAAIRPRSVIAAVVAAPAVGMLLIVGMSVQPQSLPRLVIHLLAIFCLAALVVRVIQGVAARRLRELWIVPGLVVGFAIAYLAVGLLQLPIVLQFCHWPPFSTKISSILCSG
ncbi:MAG TPA: hypothetical protein VHK65_03850 [Candidatus Dormibacteraeota bacterium]|nr:hypothetical protein [Candidatus Dormibacteraeota bacterium]